MQRQDYTLKDMKRSDWVWQLIIVAEVVLLAIGLVLGIDVGDDRPNIPDLIRAIFGQGEVLSEMWLWVARLSLVALIGTVAYYKMGPHKRNRT
jgi:H+/Cl- antiporter ClcA